MAFMPMHVYYVGAYWYPKGEDYDRNQKKCKIHNLKR